MIRVQDLSMSDGPAMDRLSVEINGLWLDADRTRWDRTRGEVVVSLCERVDRGLFNKGDFREVGQLQFVGVQDVDLQDSEGVGFYDIVRLRVSGTGVEVVTGVPFRLVLRGDTIRVSAKPPPDM